MPLYEFRCEKCGKSFEAHQSVDEHARSAPTCPSCKSDSVERLLSKFYAVTARKA